LFAFFLFSHFASNVLDLEPEHFKFIDFAIMVEERKQNWDSVHAHLGKSVLKRHRSVHTHRDGLNDGEEKIFSTE
jgi:hypothetical protein